MSSQNQIRGNSQIKGKTVTRAEINEDLFTPGESVFVDLEDHSDECDGIEVDFTLPNEPLSGSVYVFLRGTLRRPGAAVDGGEFTVTGSVVTFHVAPDTGDDLLISYRKAI